MKNTLTLIILIAIAINSYSQDYLNLKTGEKKSVIVLEVTPETVKYKSFDNQDGPTYTILKSEVTSILYSNGNEEKFNIISEEEKLKYLKGGKVELDGKLLSNNELKKLFNDSDAIDFYNKSRFSNAFGITIGSIGALGVLAGVALLSGKTSSKEDAVLLLVCGAGTYGLGFLMVPVSRSYLKSAVNSYNSNLKNKKNVSLNIGLTSNGVGFTIKF